MLSKPDVNWANFPRREAAGPQRKRKFIRKAYPKQAASAAGGLLIFSPNCHLAQMVPPRRFQTLRNGCISPVLPAPHLPNGKSGQTLTLVDLAHATGCSPPAFSVRPNRGDAATASASSISEPKNYYLATSTTLGKKCYQRHPINHTIDSQQDNHPTSKPNFPGLPRRYRERVEDDGTILYLNRLPTLITHKHQHHL